MRRWRRYLNRTVRVHTKGGTSLEGVLAWVSSDLLCLRGAAELLSEDQRADLAGETLVLRQDLDYWQAL